GSPSGSPGRAPSECPTAAASHSLSVCRRAVPLSACRSWCEATPGFRPEIPSHRLPTLRFLRSLRRPPRARPDWLAPVSIPLPAHRADRPDRTKRKTGTSAPAWPFWLSFCLSKESLSGGPSPLACSFRASISSHSSVIGFFVQAVLLPSYISNASSEAPWLHGRYPASSLSCRRWRACALATVRRSNCTCSFPAYSFHEDSRFRDAIEGINWIKFTSPYSPYSLVSGNCRQPPFRHRLNRCDRMRRTIQPSSRWKSFRTWARL